MSTKVKTREFRKSSLLSPIRVDEATLKRIDAMVKKFGYTSRSGLIREAVDEKLSELEGAEIIQLRDISKEQAQKEILEYIKGRDRVYASEIADELRLELKLTFDVVDELFKEGLVEEAE